MESEKDPSEERARRLARYDRLKARQKDGDDLSENEFDEYLELRYEFDPPKITKISFRQPKPRVAPPNV